MTISREYNFTDKEIKMLSAFGETGIDVTGAQDAESMLEDNMTWMNADDLAEELKLDKQTIGGVMASLLEKNLIEDSGESARGASVTDFYLTDEGIRAHWLLLGLRLIGKVETAI